MNKLTKSHVRGFTLFEMIIVMGIVAILAAIAVPSYQYVTNANRIAAEINGLVGDLQFARAEAIKEGQTVSVCTSTSGTGCLTGGADLKWNSGWAVFSDVNGNGAINAPADAVIRIQATFSGTDTFTGTVNFVTFNREGFAVGLPATGGMVTLHASPANNSSTRCLTINRVGLMAVTTYNGTTCT